MNAREWFLIISIPVNILLAILAIQTFIKKRKQLKLTYSEFIMEVIIAIFIPVVGFAISKLS